MGLPELDSCTQEFNSSLERDRPQFHYSVFSFFFLFNFRTLPEEGTGGVGVKVNDLPQGVPYVNFIKPVGDPRV